MIIEKFSTVGIRQLQELVRQTTRPVHTAVIHCSATKLSQDVSAQRIEAMHLQRGFKEIGYNLYITKDGTAYKGRNWNKIPAHVEGHNTGTLGICYEGGLDESGKPKDTRTPEQKTTLAKILVTLNDAFSDKDINLKWAGHRDFSPDKDGDGVVESWEWLKACPCFDVKNWVESIG